MLNGCLWIKTLFSWREDFAPNENYPIAVKVATRLRNKSAMSGLPKRNGTEGRGLSQVGKTVW